MMDSLKHMLSPMIVSSSHIIDKNLADNEFELMDRIRKYKIDLLIHRKSSSQVDFVRPVIVESWLRSYSYGLKIFDYNYAPVLSPSDFAELLHKKDIFLKAADPSIRQLESILTNTESIIYLTDEQGVFLRVIVGNSKLLFEQNKRFGIVEGSVWSEKTVGTCGHTLSLILGIPIQICGPEHYCEKHDQIACSTAPIFDNNNVLAGTLSIVTPTFHHQNPHTLALAINMAAAIQNEFRYRLNSKLLGLSFDIADEAVITLNKDGHIVYINEIGRKLFANFNKELLGTSIEEILGKQFLLKSALKNNKSVYETVIECEFVKQKLLCSVKPLIDCNINYGYVLTLRKINPIRRDSSSPGSARAKYTFDHIVGNSPQITQTVQLAKRFAQLDEPILIQGESGTGKEVFAQAIHNASRPNGPFIAVNCGAIARTLIESELFGYEKGSFTGADKQGRTGKIEMAQGGTLFLDEIGDLPYELQSALLRVIEEKQVLRIGGNRYIDVDFRLIVATNKDLISLVQNNQFREDLYFRLSVFSLVIPPLRERKSDINSLVNHFINEIAKKQQIKPPSLSNAAKCLLHEYNWPGNVRQLKNAVTYALSVHSNGIIKPQDLPQLIVNYANKVTADKKLAKQVEKEKMREHTQSMKELERKIIMDVLEKNDYCISRAAKSLGFSRATLYRKIKKYNMF